VNLWVIWDYTLGDCKEEAVGSIEWAMFFWIVIMMWTSQWVFWHSVEQ
jgi:hypothetical protein